MGLSFKSRWATPARVTRTRTTRFVWAAGLVLALLMAWAIWSVRRDLEARTRRPPDGSVLTLKTATYGKRHTERTGHRWRDLLGPLIPETLAKRLGCDFVTAGGTNTLIFWLDRESEAGKTMPRLRAATFDEHGCEYRVGEPSRHTRTPSHALLVAAFDEFPRRGKTVGLRLYEAGTNGSYTKLAEFVVPNPDRRSFPVWQPQPLPITRRVGDVDFTLLELKAGIYGRASPPRLPVPGEDRGCYFRVRIQERGRPTANWALAGVKGLSDAQGHTVARGAYAGNIAGAGEIGVVVAGGLCLEESAWRLQVEFAREKDFASNELWIVRGVPVPGADSASVVEAATNLYGVRLELRGIVGKKCPTPRVRRSLPEWPAVHLVCANLPETLELKLVGAVDDQGRPVASGGSCSDATDRLYALSLSADARNVDFTFALTRRIGVEYLVKPSPMTAEELSALRKRLGYQ